MAFNGSSLSSERANFFKGVWDKAYKASCAPYKTGVIVRNEDESTVVIAFSGPLDRDDFSETDNKFGVCEIKTNNDYFGSMVEGIAKKELPPQPALVNQGILKSFLHVWNNSNVKEQVEGYLRGGKIVLFTGHSIGGGIATLATLAILEKWPKCPSVFCITFGFPLIGDEVLARAIRRQRWANRFCHVVSKGDIFARIFLAPSTSVSAPLRILLPYWRREMQQRDDSSIDIPMEETIPENVDITKLLWIVLQHASLVVNYTSAINMDPTNKVIATVRPLVKLSPYRPFGSYMFCPSGGAVWVENDEAVLSMLYYSLVAAAADNQDQNLEASISEHIGYGSLLHGVMTNMVKLEELSNLPLSQLANSLHQSAMETQLEALGFGIQIPQARLALKAAGEVEKRRKENMKQVVEDLHKGGCMQKLKQYREDCTKQRGIPYYDCFKQHNLEADFQANINRLKLAGFWDRVAEMVEKHELPDEFQCLDEWIRVGTEYRLLVEPLDIANYYRLEKHEDSGHYLSSARPRRYSYLQKWLADKELNDNEGRGIPYPEVENMTKDSRFWAYVEEISWSMNNKRENPRDVRAKCEEFQMRVKHMIDSKDLCEEEVVLKESSFVKWWNQLSEEERAVSPIKAFFQKHTI